MASQQTTPEVPQVTISDLILFDHQKARRLYQEFQRSSILDMKQTLCWELIRELSIHTFKEEMVLYPVMRQLMGDEPADQCLEEHMEMKRLLGVIDTMKADDPAFVEKVDEVMKTVISHIDEEEQECLPKLEALVKDPDYLKELAIAFDSATKNAPTRPHPNEPNVPPENLNRNYELMIDDMKLDKQRFDGTAQLTVPMPVDALEP